MRPATVLSVLTLAPMLASSVLASTVLSLSEDQLVDRADLVVRGLVRSATSAVRATGFPVFTAVELEVIEVLKGDHTAPSVHFSMPGGDMDGRRYVVPGTPSVHPGEDVVVFLVRLPSGERTLVGMAQGKYRVLPDSTSGLTRVQRSTQGLAMIAPPPPGQTSAFALRNQAPDNDEWGAFRRRIRARVAATSKK